MQLSTLPLRSLSATNGKGISLSDVVPLLKKAKSDGKGGYTALCPAHDDHNPSLSIRAGDKQGVIVTCHSRQCSYHSIMGALGLASASPHADDAIHYEYTDENGVVLYRVARKGIGAGKSFYQHKSDGRGGWIPSVQGVRRVPYRLPELIEAVAEDRRIFIVEGEKDVETAKLYGLPATCNAGGAGKWGDDHSAHLKDADVVIIPDNDAPGRDHAEKVAKSLAGIARSIRVVNLPGLQEKGDLTDWFSEGRSLEELERLVDATSEWKPAPTSVATPTAGALAAKTLDGDPLNTTDLGNARRLVSRFGSRIRYVHAWNTWLCFSGGRWVRDDSGKIERMAKQVAQSIWDEVKAASYADQKKLADHAHRSHSRSKLDAMVALAQTEPGIAAVPADLDAKPWLLNVGNGTLDLSTGELRSHDPADLITKQVAADYDPSATCPTWDAFLDRVLGGNPDLISFLKRAVGYTLTGRCTEQVFFMLWGIGCNGKSTFIEALHKLLAEYATRASFDTFLTTKADKSGSDLARLCAARFVSASEAGDGRRFDEARVKAITGGDTIVARRLYEEPFEFTPQFKLWFAANHKPTVRGTDYAMWRRILLIPFTVTIPEGERDPNLSEKLAAEAPGILRWAVEGCREWREYGLSAPTVVTDATAEYREESDVLGEFIAECCEVGAGLSEESTKLYNAYKSWAVERGDQPLSLTKFGSRLSDEKGIPNDRKARTGRKGKLRRLGVRLLDEAELFNRGGHSGTVDTHFHNLSAREIYKGSLQKQPPTVPNYPPRPQLPLTAVVTADSTERHRAETSEAA